MVDISVKKRVLIVDDELGYQKLYERYLSRHGYAVRCVSGGDEALRVAAEFQPHVAIVDWMLMGGIDGLEVVESLKGIVALERAILVTGYPSETLEEEAWRRGVDVYLEKPVDPERLVDAVGGESGEHETDGGVTEDCADAG